MIKGERTGSFMATLKQISGFESYIRQRVELKYKTHDQISEALEQEYPRTKGLSSWSVRCFCDMHNISCNVEVVPA